MFSTSFKSLNKLFLFALSLAMVFTFTSCEDIEDSDGDGSVVDDFLFGLGWVQEEENLEEIPDDVNLGNTGNLPSSVDLQPHFPPIGNQGQYGTCVSWAVGYNMKTALEGIDKNLSTSQLASSANQFSPKYLFWAIPNNLKGPNCNGTNFEPALDVMLNQGIATEQTVPYTSLGDCSASPQSSWNNEAANFKIASYREIQRQVDVIKGYIADKRPVVFGAKLADNFMQWNSDDVLNSHSSFNQVGQHAYHAMIVNGYDDNKGPNGAFRVTNSWGNNWGDAGYIWIDYNFFVSPDFGFAMFVATNQKSDIDPEDNPDDPVYSDNVDVVPWALTDNYDGPELTDRYITYNVYNIGDKTIPSSSDWGVAYVYYNAYDANDYGIILFDYYSDDCGFPGDEGPWEDFCDPSLDPSIYSSWYNNFDIPSNSGIAEEVFGVEEFFWSYRMPNITGDYYLVLIADAFDVLDETDEENNYSFITDEFGGPIYFQNGVGDFNLVPENPEENMGIESVQLRSNARKLPHQMSKENSNAYRPSEIVSLIKHQKKTGELQAKLRSFTKQKSSTKRASK